MDRKLLMVLIFAVIGLAVLTSGCTQQGQNTTQNAMQNNTIQNSTQNNTIQENTNVSGATRDYDAIITQIGPNTPQKRGTSVPIYYTVTNKGKKTIYNAKVGGQNFEEEKNIGTLNPGQTKKYKYMLYIPTDKDLAEWYKGGNVKLTSPLVAGGPKLTFIDDKGVFHSVRSNTIEIKFK